MDQKSVELVEDGKASTIRRSRCSSISNDTTFPGTPNSISQEERPPILDYTASIVINNDITESTYTHMLAETLVTHETIKSVMNITYV